MSETVTTTRRPEFGTQQGQWSTFLPEIHDTFVSHDALHLPDNADDVWSTPGWISHLQDYAARLQFETLGRLNVAGQGHSQFSAMLVTLLCRQSDVGVLDVGGSVGENALGVLAALNPTDQSRVRWLVRDGAASVAVARRAWEQRPWRPRFADYLLDANSSETFDVALMCGTLQYVRDPLSALESLMQQLVPGSPGIYVRRTPFCISSDRHTVIRQLVYPNHGVQQRCYIGELQLHLLSLNRFLFDLSRRGMSVRFISHHQAYPIPSLPAEHQQVHYVDLLIGRTA